MRSLTILVIIILIVSCKQKHEIGDIDSITVIINEQINKNFPWSEIVDKTEVIRLESKEGVLLSAINKLIVYNDILYAYDRRLRDIFMFDNSGKFLGKPGPKGGGPEEFNEARDFEIDSEGNVYILDTNRIVVYTNDGRFLKEIKFNFINPNKSQYINPTQFAIFDECIYLYTGTIGIKNNKGGVNKSVYKIDKKGKIIDSWFPVDKKLFDDAVFSKFNNGYLLTPDYSFNTVYYVTPNNITPKYKIDFGSFEVPENLISKNLESSESYFRVLQETDYALNVTSAIESSSFLYFNYFQKGGIRAVIYSKVNANVYAGKIWLNNFSPPYFITQYNDWFYGIIEPEDYISLKNKSTNHGFELFENVVADDNPIIIKVKLKDSI
ncbi:MAG TPA: 6-bladed beta-propeller [Cyclobacteriaceae bacterium]|nr:6-bladed beta-propeller [Cyclobacteriaceae bacterium]